MSLVSALLISAASAERFDCLQTSSINGYDNDRVALYLTPEKVDSAVLDFSEYGGRPMLNVTFSNLGTAEFVKLQTGRIGKSIALCIGNHLLTEPILHEPILGGEVQISGNFNVQQVEALVAELTLED